jgi:transglutaminase-like putative cysteine protease
MASVETADTAGLRPGSAAANQPDAEAGHGLGVAYQIPRNTLALLMMAQAAVVLPYLLQLSPWIVAVGLFCGLWRTNVYRGLWDYPQRWVKTLIVFVAVAGVALSGAGAFSLETAASLLLVAFALKLIEMKSRRDAYLVIFLGYFAVATQFLFDQSILVAIYQLGALVLVTAAMISLNQRQTRVRPGLSLKLAGLLVLQAVPLTLMLFLLFPRIAPLWTVPLPGSSVTGLSDRVRPGDIANLTKSDALAFRVEFDGAVPRPNQLYWRGLVYSDWEEGGWKAAERRRARELPVPGENDLRYEVLLEPTMQTWLYSLANVASEDVGVYRTVDDRLESRDPVMSVFRYRATSHRGAAPSTALTDAVRARETAIGEADNPRLQALAAELLAEHGNAEGIMAEVLRTIRIEPYHYTLNPPQYPGPDGIDAFWFDGRAGFCEHYAGAFVYLMRAAGIPARVVGGYLGGEVNPISGHLMVRQYDAHAWAEVWLEDQGWVRVDPTGAVAPQRVEEGLSAAVSSEDLARLSVFTNARIGDWNVVASVLQWADSLEHRWNLWVVGYDTNYQSQFLEKLLGEVSVARLVSAIVGSGVLCLSAVALILFRRRRSVERHPVERAFREFSDRLAAYGYRRRPDESPSAFVRRLADEVGLAEAQIGGLVAELDTLLYNPAVAWGASELKALRSQMRRLQFRLAFGSSR